MMANGTLVRVLIHTDVTKYLYFKAVDGSYVFNKGKVLFLFIITPYPIVIQYLKNLFVLLCFWSLFGPNVSFPLIIAIGSQGASNGHGGSQVSTYGFI